jgi:hypothetical protein
VRSHTSWHSEALVGAAEGTELLDAQRDRLEHAILEAEQVVLNVPPALRMNAIDGLELRNPGRMLHDEAAVWKKPFLVNGWPSMISLPTAVSLYRLTA